MTKECFVPRDFKPDTLAVIEQANVIIVEYQEKGFTLTLRQLYYQFVSRDLIPNKQTEYKRLGSIINDARLAGLIDWSAIEDRTRNLKRQPSWDDPQDILDTIAKQYREDLWLTQPVNVEVWIEKDALVGVIEPVCQRWRVPFYACRGYSSQSEQYAAGLRFMDDAARRQRRTLVLHLGDHDPSGIDMTRDNLDRLRMFTNNKLGTIVDVKRLALNFDQVERYRPPPNPAKDTDSRAAGYIDLYGGQSWELDALNPEVIDALIDREIRAVVDDAKWARAKKGEAERRKLLGQAAGRWNDVVEFLEGE